MTNTTIETLDLTFGAQHTATPRYLSRQLENGSSVIREMEVEEFMSDKTTVKSYAETIKSGEQLYKRLDKLVGGIRRTRDNLLTVNRASLEHLDNANVAPLKKSVKALGAFLDIIADNEDLISAVEAMFDVAEQCADCDEITPAKVAKTFGLGKLPETKKKK